VISRSLGFGSLLQVNNEYGPDPKLWLLTVRHIKEGLPSKGPDLIGLNDVLPQALDYLIRGYIPNNSPKYGTAARIFCTVMGRKS